MSLQKQDLSKPLFEDLLWSRPENKRSAGKLLIVGGQAGDFINVSSAYSFTKEAGAGTVRIILPDSLRKIAGNIEGVEFAPSNSSGGFAKTALASFFDLSEWADHVLIAGDLGKNAETTVILDGFLLRGTRPITLSQYAMQSIGISFAQLLNMHVNLVIERKIFQKFAAAIGSHVPVTSLTTYAQTGSVIEDISAKIKARFVIIDDEHVWGAVNGEVVSTPTKPIDINALSAYVSVWLMQNPSKPLEALATAVFESRK